jgi:hypothetical protein
MFSSLAGEDWHLDLAVATYEMWGGNSPCEGENVYSLEPLAKFTSTYRGSAISGVLVLLQGFAVAFWSLFRSAEGLHLVFIHAAT